MKDRHFERGICYQEQSYMIKHENGHESVMRPSTKLEIASKGPLSHNLPDYASNLAIYDAQVQPPYLAWEILNLYPAGVIFLIVDYIAHQRPNRR